MPFCGVRMETQTKLTNYNLITSQMLPAFIFYLWGESLKLSENEVMFIEFMRGVHVTYEPFSWYSSCHWWNDYHKLVSGFVLWTVSSMHCDFCTQI